VLVSGINHTRPSETLMGQGFERLKKSCKKPLTNASRVVILAMLRMKERI